MKILILIALLALSLASFVKNLTDENFEHDTQATSGSTTGNFFILFYAPWCGHCKSVKPKLESFAEEIQSELVRPIIA